MRRVNNKKECVRIYLRNDIESSITNIMHESNEIQNTVIALNNAIGGSMYGIDVALIEKCHKILQNLSEALQCLNRCYGYANEIDTSEEISDE